MDYFWNLFDIKGAQSSNCTRLVHKERMISVGFLEHVCVQVQLSLYSSYGRANMPHISKYTTKHEFSCTQTNQIGLS